MKTMWPIPSLLAVSAVHQHLVNTKEADMLWPLILESGEPREVHHFATLLGYGACAVNPYLAQDTYPGTDRRRTAWIKIIMPQWMITMHAILHGIVKIASKMGISTIQSYQGAKIFEAIGISQRSDRQIFYRIPSAV